MTRGHAWARYNSRKHRYLSGFQVCHHCGLVFSARRAAEREYRICRWEEE